jgi:hypothetical protein
MGEDHEDQLQQAFVHAQAAAERVRRVRDAAVVPAGRHASCQEAVALQRRTSHVLQVMLRT